MTKQYPRLLGVYNIAVRFDSRLLGLISGFGLTFTLMKGNTKLEHFVAMLRCFVGQQLSLRRPV